MARKKVSEQSPRQPGLPHIVIPPVTFVDPLTLNAAAYNPRKIKPRQMAALRKSIRDNGFVQSLVVQRKGSVIIGGHQRLQALREECVAAGQQVPKVPCVLLDIDDAHAKRLNVALNKVGGDFDQTLLGKLFIEMEQEARFTEDDITGMGFDDREEIDRFIRIADPPKLDESALAADTSFGTSVTLSVTFGDTATRDRVKELLAKRSKAEGRTSGEIVAELLKR